LIWPPGMNPRLAQPAATSIIRLSVSPGHFGSNGIGQLALSGHGRIGLQRHGNNVFFGEVPFLFLQGGQRHLGAVQAGTESRSGAHRELLLERLPNQGIGNDRQKQAQDKMHRWPLFGPILVALKPVEESGEGWLTLRKIVRVGSARDPFHRAPLEFALAALVFRAGYQLGRRGFDLRLGLAEVREFRPGLLLRVRPVFVAVRIPFLRRLAGPGPVLSISALFAWGVTRLEALGERGPTIRPSASPGTPSPPTN
jgi:hypothetical protein